VRIVGAYEAFGGLRIIVRKPPGSLWATGCSPGGIRDHYLAWIAVCHFLLLTVL
jgi:hypothetical protein